MEAGGESDFPVLFATAILQYDRMERGADNLDRMSKPNKRPLPKEWVGLTEDEYKNIRYGQDEGGNDYVDYELFDEGEYGFEVNIYVDRFAKAIEAKLKEKNT